MTVGELAGLSSDSDGWREVVELGYPRKTLLILWCVVLILCNFVLMILNCGVWC